MRSFALALLLTISTTSASALQANEVPRFQGTQVKRANIGSGASGTYYEMENGDISLNGKGSVTDELNSLIGAFEVTQLRYRTEFTPIALAPNEDDRSLYLYFMNPDGLFGYDTVDMYVQAKSGSFSTFYQPETWIYRQYSINLSSMSQDRTLQKYRVTSLAFDPSKNYFVSVREVYPKGSWSELTEVFGIGYIWQYNSSTGEYSWSSDNPITVTNKTVGYELYNTTLSSSFAGGVPDQDLEGGVPSGSEATQRMIQRNYVAFNLSENVDRIKKIQISYDAEEVHGLLNSQYD